MILWDLDLVDLLKSASIGSWFTVLAPADLSLEDSGLIDGEVSIENSSCLGTGSSLDLNVHCESLLFANASSSAKLKVSVCEGLDELDEAWVAVVSSCSCSSIESWSSGTLV